MAPQLGYNVCQVAFAAGICSASLVSWLAFGHRGLVACACISVALCMVSDLAEVLRGSGGQVNLPKDAAAGLPLAPALPLQWHIAVLVVEGAALVAQIVLGWTVLCGMLLLGVFGACGLMQLLYYGGAWADNARTLIPMAALSIIVATMVLTSPANGRGYKVMGIHSHLAALVMLAGAPVVGAALAQVTLLCLRVKAAPGVGERAPLAASGV